MTKRRLNNSTKAQSTITQTPFPINGDFKGLILKRRTNTSKNGKNGMNSKEPFEREHFIMLLETLYSVTGHLRSIETELHACIEEIDAFYNELGPILDHEPSENWDPNKIKWTSAQGTKGPYQRYPATGEKAESTPDYRSMLAALKSHGGKMMRSGFFYWVFEDGSTVGRKRKGKA